MNPTPESGPILPAIVHRQRLRQRLDSVMAPGIVVISAQAAQGKTTLIADYLAATAARHVWMTLHPEDADPHHFLRHLIDACRPHLSPEHAALDAAAIPVRDARAPLADGLAALSASLPKDLNLVFDDWHRLGSAELAVRHITAILAARPAQGCVYLLSREDLPLALQGIRIRRQALVLSDRELAFTEEEIGAFFKIMSGQSIDAALQRRIHRLTAGWAGGLVFVLEALHRHAGRPTQMLAAPEIEARLQVEADRYFREEIFRRQSGDMQTFLAGAGLLESVTTDLIAAVEGSRRTIHLLDKARRKHLFLHAHTSPADERTYHFNPLFRAFLRTQAKTTLSPEQIHRWLHRAARHYQQGNRLDLAASCFLQAGDLDAATRAITAIGLELAIEGRFAEIRQWTARLPPSVIREDPWLCLLQAIAFRIKGGRRTIDELQSAYEAFVRLKHTRGQMLALAHLIETAVFSGYSPAAITRWIATGERLVKAARKVTHFNYAKALLWQQIGFGIISFIGGDLQKGLSACQNAVILSQRMASPVLTANTLAIAAFAHVQAGEFDQARERLRTAASQGSGETFPEYAALRHLTEGQLALIRADTGTARRKLAHVQTAIDRFGLIRLYPVLLEASGLLQVHCQEYAALEKTHRHLHDVAILLDNGVYRAIGYWLAALGGYHQGRCRQARAVLARVTAIEALPDLHQARHRLLMGFIALNEEHPTESLQHFRPSLRYFENSDLAVHACEARLGMALAQQASQDLAAAAQSLALAFQPAGRLYAKLPIIKPADLARACMLCIELKVAAAVDHARHMLARRIEPETGRNQTGTPAGGQRKPSANTLAPGGSSASSPAPVLVICTLGGLGILRNGRDPLAARDWQGGRPALLLKAILVHGSRHIPKDILIEALWPDRKPASSLQNFKVTLHRLRKLMEPDLKPSQGSAYIHLKDNLVSLDNYRCEVDTDVLHRLCKRVRRAGANLDVQDLRDIFREADTLYRGDFLPEEPYLTWTEMKRTTLRREFIQLLYRLGESLEAQQAAEDARHCYRRIATTDPGQERAQRRLMRLLAAAGRPQEALHQYHRLQRYLETEIGAAPDGPTVELFRAIRGQGGAV